MNRDQETSTSAPENPPENKNEAIIKGKIRANLTEMKTVVFKDCKNSFCTKTMKEESH